MTPDDPKYIFQDERTPFEWMRSQQGWIKAWAAREPEECDPYNFRKRLEQEPV